jgi:hypothetical protein
MLMVMACFLYFSYCLLRYFWIRIVFSSTYFLFIFYIASDTPSGCAKLMKTVPVPDFCIWSLPSSSKNRLDKRRILTDSISPHSSKRLTTYASVMPVGSPFTKIEFVLHSRS